MSMDWDLLSWMFLNEAWNGPTGVSIMWCMSFMKVELVVHGMEWHMNSAWIWTNNCGTSMEHH